MFIGEWGFVYLNGVLNYLKWGFVYLNGGGECLFKWGTIFFFFNEFFV